jgi:hypothetical protein
MYSPTSKIKPMLAYLLPVAMVFPSLIWITIDESVWPWDQAFYGKGSVELFYTLIHSPKLGILPDGKETATTGAWNLLVRPVVRALRIFTRFN